MIRPQKRIQSNVLALAPLVWMAILLIFLFGWQVSSSSAEPPAPNMSPEAEMGRKTAAVFCVSCHSLPDPQLLDKETWRKKALPSMAPWLGVAKVKLPDSEEGNRLHEAHLFPTSPLLSRDQWAALNSYFEETAPAVALTHTNRAPPQSGLSLFRPRLLQTTKDLPYTSLVKIAPGVGVYVGDAQERTLRVLGQDFIAKRDLSLPSAPVAIQSQGSNIWLTLVGRIFPSDEWAGQVWKIRADQGSWSHEVVIENLPRLASTSFADFTGDGLGDLVVSGYGNRLGKLMLFQGQKDGKYSEKILSPLPGSISTHIEDLDHDGKPDILLLRGQAREGVFAFYNRGDHFEEKALIEFPSAYGTAGWQVLDFNGDGKTDLVIACGDMGDYPSRPRAYHGIRLYLGDGNGHFKEAWSYPMNGAYGVRVADFDGDGDLDIAAISFFPDYTNAPQESFLYFRNEGGFKFTPFTFPFSQEGRWLVMDAGDIDGDGDVDIVLGSFPKGPLTIPIPDTIGDHWMESKVSVVVLENTTRDKKKP